VPREEHESHVQATHERLWKIRQYPCTGLGAWLKPTICLSTVYAEILQRAKDGQTVVDVGTYIGHDLRRLVVDGAPSADLWGIDIVDHFDVGFGFFKDRDRWHGQFVEADVLTVETNDALAPLRGKTDVLYIASVMHQWDWAGQVRTGTALTQFTRPGAIIAGLQAGKAEAGIVLNPGLTVPVWVHSPESWVRLWDEIGVATGTRWETQAWLRLWEWVGVDRADMAWMGSDLRLFEFVMRRVE